MCDEATSVGKVFIEYIVINRARNDRVALKSLAWEETAEPSARTFPLAVSTEAARYVESFHEEEIRYCLSRPSCFSSVERKINTLIGRIRGERHREARDAGAERVT